MADLEPTYYDVGNIGPMGMAQGDQAKVNYDLWKAIAAICNNLDEDLGNPGTDYMSKIGTDLNTALAKMVTPKGPVT